MTRRVIVACLLLIIARNARSQTTATGKLYGTVTDSQGGTLPGVTVSASSPSTSLLRSMTTDSRGDYRLDALPPGEYTIVAELAGFERTSQRNVDVRAGGNLRVDLTMSVGAVSETIEVTKEAPLLESRN